MSHLEPHGAESRPRKRPTAAGDRAGPDRGQDARSRAWHDGAAPEDYGEHPGYGRAGLDGYRPDLDATWPQPERLAADRVRVRPDVEAYPAATAPGRGYGRPDDGLRVGGYPARGGPGVPVRPDVAPGGYDEPDDEPDHDGPAAGRSRPPGRPDSPWPRPTRLPPPPPPGRDDETNPTGWPAVDPPLVPPPADPPVRRGPGRRRAGRSRDPSRPSRAGRDLPAAIGVGLGLAAVILVPLFTVRPLFFVVLAAAVALGIWEMSRAVRRAGARPPEFPLMAGGVVMVGLAAWAGPDALSLGLVATVVASIVWRLSDGPVGYQRDMTAAALITVYVPFLGGFGALLAAPPDGDLRVLVTLAAVVLSDTGGYVAGVWLGRHPMAPSISPKKSWEGLAGSVVAAGVGGAVLLRVLFDVDLWWGGLFGLAVAGAAVLGDLGESMIKRDLGVKDMSSLLPGHGGIMDRLDSILFAVPISFLILSIFAPPA